MKFAPKGVVLIDVKITKSYQKMTLNDFLCEFECELVLYLMNGKSLNDFYLTNFKSNVTCYLPCYHKHQ